MGGREDGGWRERGREDGGGRERGREEGGGRREGERRGGGEWSERGSEGIIGLHASLDMMNKGRENENRKSKVHGWHSVLLQHWGQGVKYKK